MTTTTDDKVIARIKKLLALAASSNPYEAAQAMGRAQELMSAHRIEAAVLQEEGGEIEEVQSDVLFAVLGSRRVVSWHNILIAAFDKANGIKTYYGYVDGRLVVKAVGQPGVVRVAGFACTAVVHEINRLATPASRGQGLVWRNSFCRGAAAEVGKRILAQAAVDVPAVPTGEEGLVAAGALATVAAEVSRQYDTLSLRHTYSQARHSPEAARAGRAAGAGIDYRAGARGALQ